MISLLSNFITFTNILNYYPILKKTCLIIDDEPLARKRINTMVMKVPELLLLDECKTGMEAIEKITLHSPDLIFLDIQMKDMSGFDVLKKLNTAQMPLVIFITAFDSYAVKAFEYLAFDYLLKPFKKDRFLNSVSRALHHFEAKKVPHSNEKIDQLLSYLDTIPNNKKDAAFQGKLPIKAGNSISFLDIEDIIYVTAAGSYIDIKTKEKTFVQRSSLGHFLGQITSQRLIRIHRSTIINLNFLDKIIQSNYGEIDVKMSDNSLFRISKSYKKEFQKTLGI